MDVGFVPIVCTTSLSFFAVFIIKALLPYAVVLSVGIGLRVTLRYQKQESDITTVQRLVSSAVYVVYYLYPSMVTHLLRIFHCTDPILGAGYAGETYLFTDLAVECGVGQHSGARVVVLDKLTYAGNLANLLSDTGRMEEAETLYRATYDARKKKLGEDHPDTLSSAGNLGVLLDKKARELDEKGATDPAALAQIYTEAADMRALKYGAEHEAVVRCRKRAAKLAGPKSSACAIQ